PSLVELLPVKAKWGVSLGALIKHLHTSELLTEPRFEALRRQLYTRVNPDTDTTWGRVEPGWNDREVERPRLISKWLEMGFSARSAAMLAPYDLMWPQDLLEDFMAGQRAAPGRQRRMWRWAAVGVGLWWGLRHRRVARAAMSSRCGSEAGAARAH
ncbi:hypothetical protein, partial [Streptomyces millisiae]